MSQQVFDDPRSVIAGVLDEDLAGVPASLKSTRYVQSANVGFAGFRIDHRHEALPVDFDSGVAQQPHVGFVADQHQDSVGLQLDGFTPEVHTAIRGRDLVAEKTAALAALKELNISTQLIYVATRGVNEHQIGQAVELFLSGASVAPYSHGNRANHSEERQRKLLMRKKDILKIGGKVTEKGLTLIPLKAYFKGGLVKFEIGLARGRKSHDKREAIKARDIEKDVRRELGTRRR